MSNLRTRPLRPLNRWTPVFASIFNVDAAAASRPWVVRQLDTGLYELTGVVELDFNTADTLTIFTVSQGVVGGTNAQTRVFVLQANGPSDVMSLTGEAPSAGAGLTDRDMAVHGYLQV